MGSVRDPSDAGGTAARCAVRSAGGCAARTHGLVDARYAGHPSDWLDRRGPDLGPTQRRHVDVIARHASVYSDAHIRLWRGSRRDLGRRCRPAHAAPRSDVDSGLRLRATGDGCRAQDLPGMSMRTINWFKYASAGHAYRLAGRLVPWFAVPAALLFVLGLYLGLFAAPTDFQQGDAYRVLFVHVPAAWMGMLLYVVLAFYAAVGWIFNARVSSMMASSLSIT